MKKKRAALAVLLAVCIICGLSACGGKTKEKTEEEISNDLQSRDEYFDNYNLNLDSFSVSKRQTNKEDKYDLVWCEIAASNADFSYSATYELTYVLYNDGWLLENCSKSDSGITPSNYPTEDEVMAVIHAEFNDDNIQLYNAIDSETDTEITYPFRIPSKPMYRNGIFMGDSISSTYAVFFRFNPKSGWSSEIKPVEFR